MTTTNPSGSGPGEQAGPAEFVRSEERLRVRTRTQVTGRVRVRKQVVSREVTQTLRREELVVEELPLEGTTADGSPLAGAEGQEIELVLHEERLVVVSVPVERVRVRVHRVRENVTVSEVLRRERIDVDVTPSAEPGTNA